MPAVSVVDKTSLTEPFAKTVETARPALVAAVEVGLTGTREEVGVTLTIGEEGGWEVTGTAVVTDGLPVTIATMVVVVVAAAMEMVPGATGAETGATAVVASVTKLAVVAGMTVTVVFREEIASMGGATAVGMTAGGAGVGVEVEVGKAVWVGLVWVGMDRTGVAGMKMLAMADGEGMSVAVATAGTESSTSSGVMAETGAEGGTTVVEGGGVGAGTGSGAVEVVMGAGLGRNRGSSRTTAGAVVAGAGRAAVTERGVCGVGQ